MKTKKQMMSEMIANYKHLSGRTIGERTLDLLYKYSQERRLEQVERCYNLSMAANNAAEASFAICCCTRIALRFKDNQ